MPVIVMTKGLPASGKSTWAKEQVAANPGWIRINKDDLRAMLYNSKWSAKNERYIKSARNALILNFMRKGLNIIIDDTNFHPSHEINFHSMIKDHNNTPEAEEKNNYYELEIKSFDISIEDAVKRDLARPVSVGRDVIEKMYYDFVFEPEVPVIDVDIPWAVICDLDGTLALFNDRSPYEHMKCDTDTVNQKVLQALQMYSGDYQIIILSGRDDESRIKTVAWMKDNGVPYNFLFMRKNKDTRPDTVIKRELYEAHIKDKFNVAAVFDDRLGVCRLWNQLGLFVFNVNQNNIRF